jgi:hypothetical protein
MMSALKWARQLLSLLPQKMKVLTFLPSSSFIKLNRYLICTIFSLSRMIWKIIYKIYILSVPLGNQVLECASLGHKIVSILYLLFLKKHKILCIDIRSCLKIIFMDDRVQMIFFSRVFKVNMHELKLQKLFVARYKVCNPKSCH